MDLIGNLLFWLRNASSSAASAVSPSKKFDLASPLDCDGGVGAADRLEIVEGDDCLS